MDKGENYNKLKKIAFDLGAVAFGVCAVVEEKNSFNIPPDVLKDLDLAVSVAVPLSRKILDEIVDKPTRLYFHHYKQANCLLDHIAMRISSIIGTRGYCALPVPASQITDWQKQQAHLSHKKIAEMAGIGWLGRHNIIVHPEYGAHIRLVTILTDMPLSTDKKAQGGCGDCKKCVVACPAGAIKESQGDFDHIACFEKLKYFQKQRYVDQYICGICVKACLPGR